MKCREVTALIEEKYPCRFAENWDNVGLLVGNTEKEVHKILVAVDCLDEVIDHAIEIGADMIVTHHPMIFSAMKKITSEHFIGKRILKLAANDICYYAMHTNFDVLEMNEAVLEKLDLCNVEILDNCFPEEHAGFGFIGDLKKEMSLRELSETVKEAFGLPGVVVYEANDKKVKRLACCPGSGKSFLDEAIDKKADAYLTGDIDYHTGIDSKEKGLSLIDAGHYGIEHVFIAHMTKVLEELLKGEISVESMNIEHPFYVI